jgi:hypothetical protein
MAINYAKLFNRRVTPQSRPIPGSTPGGQLGRGYSWPHGHHNCKKEDYRRRVYIDFSDLKVCQACSMPSARLPFHRKPLCDRKS